MIQAFRDSNQRSQPAREPAIAIVERSVRHMVIFRLGFAVVIPDNSGGERSVAPFKTRNVTIHREIFAVLVMALLADGMSNVVQQRSFFQNDPGRARKKMPRTE